MPRLRIPTTVLLAGIVLGSACDLALAQGAGGYRWVTGEPTEVKEPVVEELADLPVPAKIYRYAQTLVGQYDVDRSGLLESREWTNVRVAIDPRLADADRDNAITVDEMARSITNYGRYRKIRMPRRPVEVVWEEEDSLELAIEPSATDPQPEEPTAESSPVAEPEPAPESGAEGEAVAEADLIEKPAEGSEPDESPAAEPEAEETPAVVEPAPVRTLKPSPPEPKAIDPRLLPRGTKYFTPRRRMSGMPEWFQTRDSNGDGQISLAEYSSRPTQSTIAKFRSYDRNKDGVITTSEYARASGGR